MKTEAFENAFEKGGVAGMTQWWERSPPTNVSRVRFLDPASYVGWVCCWFSTLLREVFLRVLRFSPLSKNQHFQIPIRSKQWHFWNEFLWPPWCSVGKQITLTFCIFWKRLRNKCFILSLQSAFSDVLMWTIGANKSKSLCFRVKRISVHKWKQIKNASAG